MTRLIRSHMNFNFKPRTRYRKRCKCQETIENLRKNYAQTSQEVEERQKKSKEEISFTQKNEKTTATMLLRNQNCGVIHMCVMSFSYLHAKMLELPNIWPFTINIIITPTNSFFISEMSFLYVNCGLVRRRRRTWSWWWWCKPLHFYFTDLYIVERFNSARFISFLFSSFKKLMKVLAIFYSQIYMLVFLLSQHKI